MVCVFYRDAQRLEVFYSRNQNLKEQNKTLKDTISLLEERYSNSLKEIYAETSL